MDINATLIAQAIVFTAFVAICWKYIYPPMLSMMHEREQRIAEGLEAAKKAEEAKLAFTRAAKAANLAAEQAAKEAAEQAAQLASELAAAKSKASRIIAEEEAAAALARQAEAHAAQIQQTWRF